MKKLFVRPGLFTLLIACIFISGCATTAVQEAKIERMTPEDMAKLVSPSVAAVSLDEIVSDSKQKKTPDEIIAKIKASNSRYELTPAQTLSLNKQGVDSKVLDYIHESNELAKQNAMADEMNKRIVERAEAEKALKRERNMSRRGFYDPFWGPRFGGFYGSPYFGYGRGFGWGGFGPYGWW